MTDVNKVIETKLLEEVLTRVRKSVRGLRFNQDQAERVVQAFQEEVQKKTTQQIPPQKGTEFLVSVEGSATLKVRAETREAAEVEARNTPMATGKWDHDWYWDDLEVSPRGKDVWNRAVISHEECNNSCDAGGRLPGQTPDCRGKKLGQVHLIEDDQGQYWGYLDDDVVTGPEPTREKGEYELGWWVGGQGWWVGGADTEEKL